ncbi:MAG TPA: hypothetical protein VGE11_25070, partial [Pseudonocardia sp.]
MAERIRPRLVRAAGFATGAGIATVVTTQLGIVDGGGSALAVGSTLAISGLTAFVRAVWTPRQIRGPPRQAFVRGLRAHGARMGTSLAAGTAGPLVWGLLDRVGGPVWTTLSTQPGLLGIKALLAPLVTAGLIHRYVLRRQYANRASGMQTSPRRDARRSALAAYLITASFGLVRAFSLITGPWWAAPLAIGAVVGFVNGVVQKKDSGRTRVIKAVVSGALSATGATILRLLAAGVVPAAWNDLFYSVAIATSVAAAPTVVAEYVNVAVGRVMAPIAKRDAERARRRAAGPDTGRAAERQRRRLQAWLDYKNFSPVNTHLLVRKAADPILAGLSSLVINLGWVRKTWVEAHDNTLPVVLGRFAAAATVVWVVGKLLRDPDEHRAGYYGYRGSRAMRSPDRPSRWLWWRGDRLGRRVAGYRANLDTLLNQLGLPVGRDDTLAVQVAQMLWDRISAPIHDPLDEWERLHATPEIRRALRRARESAEERGAHHVEAIKLVVPVLAADLAALERVEHALRAADRAADAEIVAFQRVLSQTLWSLAGLTPASPSSRVWAERLSAAVRERNRLRAEYLAGPRQALLTEIRQYYLDNLPEHPNLGRARA